VFAAMAGSDPALRDRVWTCFFGRPEIAGRPFRIDDIMHSAASRSIVFVLTLAVLLAGAPRCASAQETPADLAREMAALRQEVERLRREIDALKTGPPSTSAAPVTPSSTTATADLEMVKAQIAELAQVAVQSESKMPVRIFGVVHTHLFGNSDSANWLESPNLVDVPLPDGGGGTFGGSLRQTRLGVAIDGPTLGSARTSGVVAVDFFGGVPGFQTGQVMGLPRLLVAYARVDGKRTSLLVGQDHVILAPRDPTSLAAFSFPLLFRSGNLYLRAPQVRIEHAVSDRLRVIGGIVSPVGGDLTGSDYRFVPPALGGERSMRPGVQARLLYQAGDQESTRFAGAGVSGHYGWERRAGRLDRSWAAALDFGGRRDRIGVAGEVFVGDNADAFGGAAGLDRRAAGGWAELQLFLHRRMSFHGGAGIDDVHGGDRATLARRGNRSAFGSVLFTLTPEIQASLEYRWLSTRPGAGAARTNHHVDWVMTYRF
jgi:hypothetical protein